VSGDTSLKQTPMHAAHVAAGARMIEFGGWHMPVQYSGVIDEHIAVRTRAGLFDVSHMGEVTVRGPQALDYLQHVTCNNVARLKPGRAQYTGVTNPQGGFVDDMLVYMLGERDYMMVPNAATTAKDVAWLEAQLERFDVELRNVSDEWAQLALQGPRSVQILQPLVEPDLGALKYFQFVRTPVEGADCIVSRTGYTGEDGFEIYAPTADGERIWNAVMRAGKPHGLQPTGLAARDTLRLEAKLPLYGNDIDDTTTAYEADLGWIVKLKKGDFIGRDVLARQAAEGTLRKLAGFEMSGRGIARHGYPVCLEGEEIGRVTSGSFAPFLKKNIGLAYLPTAAAVPGTEFQIEIRGRTEPAVVVPTPFYQRSR